MKSIKIMQLYPRDMNIYGDWGNVLVLKKRLMWRGFKVEVVDYNVGDSFDEISKDVDIIVGGGGQDSGQMKIQNDLIEIGPKLKMLALNNVPMLMICGMYQLFGHYFITGDGQKIDGIGLLDITTRAGNERLIGNITTESRDFGMIVGFENHSGLTTLGPKTTELAKVIRGAGNNNQDGSEGARQHNVIGSYLHGSLLPKNPLLADWLIKKAVQRKYQTEDLAPLDDDLADQARQIAAKLPV